MSDSFEAQDFSAAYERIKPYIHRTPLIHCTSVSEAAGRRVLLKCENLQRTGSFKIRGATNATRATMERETRATESSSGGSSTMTIREFHFVTHSSGNHGQALALAARMLTNAGASSSSPASSSASCVADAKAHIIVPRTAPATKVLGMKGFGAEVHMCEPTLDSRMKKCDSVVASIQQDKTNNANASKSTSSESPVISFIHPFDNPDVIRGQGTIALEILEQFEEFKERGSASPLSGLGAVIVPVGGGGMISGISAAIKSVAPHVKVFGAEPANANDASRSVSSGKRETTHTSGLATPDTIADGLLTFTSERTFSLIQKHVDGIFEVSEDQIKMAFELIYTRAKLVIEPSAAVGVAASIFCRDDSRLAEVKGTVAIVLCGGNVDFDKISSFSSKL